MTLENLYKHLGKLQTYLTQVDNKRFSNIQETDGKLTFEYLGGKFLVFKKLTTNNPEEAELVFFHDSSIPNKELIALQTLKLIVNYRGMIKMSHHLPQSDTRFRLRADDNGFVNLYNDEDFSWVFSAEFDGFMDNNPFELYF